MSACVTVQTGAMGVEREGEKMKKNKKNNGVDRTGSQRAIPTVDVQAISRLFHELLTAKLFCVPHNKNKKTQMRNTEGEMDSGIVSASNHQNFVS